MVVVVVTVVVAVVADDTSAMLSMNSVIFKNASPSSSKSWYGSLTSLAIKALSDMDSSRFLLEDDCPRVEEAVLGPGRGLVVTLALITCSLTSGNTWGAGAA